ncbi:MAG: hypothetical protein PVJ61_03160 [Dehalococcoidia bacterium]|jgi:uncharacterized membrane protein YphA (DoxX/SURF4 family)
MKKPDLAPRWKWIVIIVVPCVLLGLMMLVAGIGKLPGLSDLGTFPGQTEFFDVIFGPIWPTVAFFINNILPWLEVVLGLALVLSIYPRIAAIVTIPLLAGFMTSNIWAIAHGESFGSCGCWGIFESVFGNTTPIQALGMDIVLLFFAVLIIFYFPAPFLRFQSWFKKTERSRD